jgi:apolipoprotein D and lipocalin family protein
MIRSLLFIGCLFLCLGCTPTRPPPATVPRVDLARYAGTWYEIARYDHWFERDLEGVTATYTVRSDGRIDVLNRGRKGALNGPESYATAIAWVVAPGQLKVSFFWPFAGDYWVLGVAEDYRWAVVGAPGRDYLWFLARSPRPAPADLEQMRAVATAAGYDLQTLLPVAHAP